MGSSLHSSVFFASVDICLFNFDIGPVDIERTIGLGLFSLMHDKSSKLPSPSVDNMSSSDVAWVNVGRLEVKCSFSFWISWIWSTNKCSSSSVVGWEGWLDGSNSSGVNTWKNHKMKNKKKWKYLQFRKGIWFYMLEFYKTHELWD